jgi:hypothetical protein
MYPRQAGLIFPMEFAGEVVLIAQDRVCEVAPAKSEAIGSVSIDTAIRTGTK